MSLFDLQDKPPPHSSLKPPPPPPPRATAARLRRKIVSGQFDEENPFVLISSVLLVQADEGVLFLVMDRIGDIYRNIPRRADVIVTTVGARHKCQQATDLSHCLFSCCQIRYCIVHQLLAQLLFFAQLFVLIRFILLMLAFVRFVHNTVRSLHLLLTASALLFNSSDSSYVWLYLSYADVNVADFIFSSLVFTTSPQYRISPVHQISSISDFYRERFIRFLLFTPKQTSPIHAKSDFFSLYATQLTASTAGLNVSEAVHVGLHVREAVHAREANNHILVIWTFNVKHLVGYNILEQNRSEHKTACGLKQLRSKQIGVRIIERSVALFCLATGYPAAGLVCDIV
ncbi:carboxylesterase 1-like [Dorcoceras hygrometricum]|uniref:Carboxylesterase 1-like n=1 Tax=Dorcoceras hygrometricum TaxID=472368 RepID=A0A2Z7ACP5_9LAMI|nr:carboxylesterase 1-like [Dorcoceras hygrometricum]